MTKLTDFPMMTKKIFVSKKMDIKKASQYFCKALIFTSG